MSGKYSVIKTLAERWRQVYIKPCKGASQSGLYLDIVRRGKRFEGSLEHFTGSENDELREISTPVGSVSAVIMESRRDFVTLYQVFGYKCEPVEIPETVGGVTILGVADWEKIRAHKKEYLLAGNTDWSSEFSRFTQKNENFKTTLILLTQGYYSAVPPEKTPYSAQEWGKISREIRLWHETAHFVYSKREKKLKSAVYEELAADCAGMAAALGSVNAELEMLFLGIENGKYVGGRLEWYISKEKCAALAQKISDVINEMARLPFDGDIFAFIERLACVSDGFALRLPS